MKISKSEIQKLLQKAANYDVIQSGAFSNKTSDLNKIKIALEKKAVIVIIN